MTHMCLHNAMLTLIRSNILVPICMRNIVNFKHFHPLPPLYGATSRWFHRTVQVACMLNGYTILLSKCIIYILIVWSVVKSRLAYCVYYTSNLYMFLLFVPLFPSPNPFCSDCFICLSLPLLSSSCFMYPYSVYVCLVFECMWFSNFWAGFPLTNPH